MTIRSDCCAQAGRNNTMGGGGGGRVACIFHKVHAKDKVNQVPKVLVRFRGMSLPTPRKKFSF